MDDVRAVPNITKFSLYSFEDKTFLPYLLNIYVFMLDLHPETVVWCWAGGQGSSYSGP